MAEFSEEYQKAIGSSYGGDFSIVESFKRKRLMEGMSAELVCEGFGSVGIKNIEGRCYLLYQHREAMLLDEAIKSLT